ncbi:MAG: CotH kinase family protein, partial [Phycisphaerae bacterium]
MHNRLWVSGLVVLTFATSIAQAQLFEPPLSNASFEDNSLYPGALSYSFDAWHDLDGKIEYTTGPDGNGLPLTPYGNNWAALVGSTNESRSYIYQQVGTWSENMVCSLSFLFGKRAGLDTFPMRIALWAGGNSSLAADGVSLSSLGATMIDNVVITPDFKGLDVATAEQFLLLNAGSGFYETDPLWLEFKSVGGVGSWLFMDNIKITAAVYAYTPAPSNAEQGVNPDLQLQWQLPELPEASYEMYFGTNPVISANPHYTNVQPPFDCGLLNYQTKYYWRIDTITDGEVFEGDVWTFTTGGKASNPSPADGLEDVAFSDKILAWTGDSWASSYKVYAGKQLPLAYLGEVAASYFSPLPTPDALTTYYWRVDEYVDGRLTVSGDTWQFSTQERAADCPAGDISGDCRVGLPDILYLAEQWLDPFACEANPDFCAELTGDNEVNMEDEAVVAANWLKFSESKVVINELHYNPDVSTESVEFVELYNSGQFNVDISNWSFCDGISFTFPQGTDLPAGGYLVIAEDPALGYSALTVSQKYSIPPSLVMGPFTGSLNNDGERVQLCDSNGTIVDSVDYQLGFPWPTVGDVVPEGTIGTGRSIQLVNSSLDNDLGGSWRSAYPSPAARNSAVFAENIAPQIRQVDHSPELPKSNEEVVVTAKVTDPDGVRSVTLSCQYVDPGNYIAMSDSGIENFPVSFAMVDDGTAGDKAAYDNVYTAVLPAEVQLNRRLVRYRITFVDNLSNSLTVPYADDPQYNFAYFVYDGVPAWTGAVQPGVTTETEYGKEVMTSLPAYHLISKNEDVEDATWRAKYTGSDYLWEGALVYDGKVYDHIRYRARGGGWRYAMGKNMWKFKFNRGHDFQARDDYGDKYATRWDTLNLGACIQQGDYWHRGEQGMFEATGFKLFNMMGVEAPNTNWVQFRIIDEASEAGANQFSGDLWGLYLAIEQLDGRYLDQHDLPDGNLYKIENFEGTLSNQGPTQTPNGLDYINFRNNWYNASTKPSEAWWRENVDLERYYGYRCVVEGIHHGDIGYGKNYFFYHNPLNEKWTMYPWDLDLTWANNMYGDGQEPFINYWHGNIFTNSNLLIEYNNRLREFHDLLYNDDQLYALIDEFAAIIDEPDGARSFVDVDRAMWDYNPVMVNSALVNTSKAGQGRFYAGGGGITIPSPGGFPGMVQLMKNYVTATNKSFDTWSEDSSAPYTPVVSYLGSAGYPVNDLLFKTSPYADPQGSSSFAAMKWRIAEVRPFSKEPLPASTSPVPITLVPQNASDWRYFKGLSEPSDAVGAWRLKDFGDSDWLLGQTSIGYGDDDDNTILTDMYNTYVTLYLRKEFAVSDIDRLEDLNLHVNVDDGCIVWING